MKHAKCVVILSTGLKFKELKYNRGINTFCNALSTLCHANINPCVKHSFICTEECFPKDFLNGLLTNSSKINIGGTVMYKCNTGFSLEGNIIRTCLQTGQLSGTPPKCESEHFYY